VEHDTIGIIEPNMASAPCLPLSRYNRGDPQLAADAEELRAALAPADTAALRQRGAARFAAGDAEGAVEAWSLLLGLRSPAVQGVCPAWREPCGWGGRKVQETLWFLFLG
jgi:hypothetical protein